MERISKKKKFFDWLLGVGNVVHQQSQSTQYQPDRRTKPTKQDNAKIASRQCKSVLKPIYVWFNNRIDLSTYVK